MKNPQKTAKELLKIKHLNSIAQNGCCAFVYIWCLGIEPDDELNAIEILDDAIEQKKLGEDCLVYWSEFGSWLTGREINVEFVDIKDIKKIKERTPVFYSTKKRNADGSLPEGHWVGVENGKIRLDPMGIGNSQNVKYGNPLTMRRITIKGIKK
ncbi:MAG: hypothetical protein MJZ03_03335 [archaeon]|nr:hypothetical protein [archaeon]